MGTAPTTAPTTVIFDMDDVLCRYDFDRRLARLAELTGVAPDFRVPIFWPFLPSRVFPSSDFFQIGRAHKTFPLR